MAFHVNDHFINVVGIFDETNVELDEPVLPKKLMLLQPIFSSDGLPNEILDFRSAKTVKEYYGQDMDNIEKYGQGGLNVLHAMEGGATAQICRLLSENVRTANLGIALQITKVENMPVYELDERGIYKLDSNGKKVPLMETVEIPDPSDPSLTTTETRPKVLPLGARIKLVKGGFEVEKGTVRYKKVTFDSELKVIQETKDVTYRDPITLKKVTKSVLVDVEEDSTAAEANRIVVPMYYMEYFAPGVVGNSYSHRIINDFMRDKQTDDGRRYKLVIEKKDDKGNIVPVGDETLFSFNPNARITKGSSILESLKAMYPNLDKHNNPKRIQIKSYQANYEKLAAFLNSVINEVSNEIDGYHSVNDVDFINCRLPNGNPSRTFVREVEDDPVDFNWVSVALQNGSDGELGPVGSNYLVEVGNGAEEVRTVDTEESREEVKQSLLRDFFSGRTDLRMFDERLVDSEVVFDANYDKEMKDLILNKFRIIRPDIMTIMDCGFTNNVYDGIREVRDLYSRVDGEFGYTAAILCQAGITTDREMPLRVTGTYDYAYGMAKCYDENGTFSIFAGYETGKMTTMKFDWYPLKDENDTQIGPLLTLGAIYAMEIVKHTTWAYMSEPTMYSKFNSKLKSIRNGMVIGDGIRLAKKELIKFSYDSKGAVAAMDKATKALQEKVVGRYPDNLGVSYEIFQTERDKLINNSTCRMIFTYPDVAKTWSLEIYARRNQSE